MTKLTKLANRLEEQSKRVANLANDLAKHYTKNVVEELTLVTPVDTSKALSNWQVSLGQAPTQDIEAYSIGSRGSTRTSSANVTQQYASVILRGKKRGTPIYISNLTSYIVDLDKGSSRQAPAGFVKATVESQLVQLLSSYKRGSNV